MRQLLVDVSVIAQRDARTGIQRVVRAILSELQRLSPANIHVRPIAASRKNSFRYLPANRLEPGIHHLQLLEEVEVAAGDIFLGLDLSAPVLPKREAELRSWRTKGVTLNFVVYDLLPMTSGRWFTWKARRNFRSWFATVERCADRLIAISNQTAQDLKGQRSWLKFRKRRAIPITKVHLGGDISASSPSKGLPADADAVIEWLKGRPTILMVGTVEPRKGHEQVFSAFQQLWRETGSLTPQLLVIGKAGWKTGKIQRSMARCSGCSGMFVWRDDVSDEFLELLYERCSGVIVASHAEGFGLPLMEAACHGIPVLARDLPVFRELRLANVTYFDSEDASSLAQFIREWCREWPSNRDRKASRSWTETASELLQVIGIDPVSHSRVKPQPVDP